MEFAYTNMLFRRRGASVEVMVLVAGPDGAMVPDRGVTVVVPYAALVALVDEWGRPPAPAPSAPPVDEPTARCTHPDRGAAVAVECPACHSPIRLPADPVDAAADRHCPVCNGQLPYLPAVPKP